MQEMQDARFNNKREIVIFNNILYVFVYNSIECPTFLLHYFLMADSTIILQLIYTS